jgi:hypothetical protein
MKNRINNKNNGFSTLLIVILIGSVALTLALTLSTSSVWSIKSSTDTKNGNITKAMANACAEVALEMLREDNNYIGSGSTTIDSNVCDYTVTNTGGTTRLIVISSVVNGITRRLNIETGSFNPLVISSWQEVE